MHQWTITPLYKIYIMKPNLWFNHASSCELACVKIMTFTQPNSHSAIHRLFSLIIIVLMCTYLIGQVSKCLWDLSDQSISLLGVIWLGLIRYTITTVKWLQHSSMHKGTTTQIEQVHHHSCRVSVSSDRCTIQCTKDDGHTNRTSTQN